MSRIGKKDIILNDSVKILFNRPHLQVEGKYGSLKMTLHEDADLRIEKEKITILVKNKKISGDSQDRLSIT